MNNPIISIHNLCVNYITSGKPIEAVNDVSFDIKRGEIFGLVGESGSGKSTVVQAILRILPPPAVIAGGKVLITIKIFFPPLILRYYNIVGNTFLLLCRAP